MKSVIAALTTSRFCKWMARIAGYRVAGEVSAVVANAGWLLLDKCCRVVFGLLVGAWVARYLGPSQFGELAYVMAYLGIFQVIASMGVDGIAVRELSRNRDCAPEVMGSAFAMKLTAAVACLSVATIGMAIFAQSDAQRAWLCLLAGGGMIFQAADIVDVWFQSQSQSRLTVFAKMMAYVLANALKVVLIVGKAPLLAFATLQTIESVLAAVSLFAVYRTQSSPATWIVARRRIKSLLTEGWPFVLSGISVAVYMRLDQLLIEALLGEKQLGIYAAVLPLATVWQFIPLTLSASLAPYVARRKAEGDAEYWRALSKIFRIFAALGWAVSIPISLLAPFLVRALFGPEYQEGAQALSIYAFTNILINLGVAQGLWIVNERRPRILLYKTIVGALVAVISNITLIPRFGLIGVAISALIAQATAVLLTNWTLSRRILHMQLRSMMLLPA